VSVGASPSDRFGKALFGFGSDKERLAQLPKSTRVSDLVGVWLVVFETSSQLLGLVDDLVNGSWHWSPQILRSRLHRMYNAGALAGTDDADLEEVAGAVGADEHRHALVQVLDENRVVEGVEDTRIYNCPERS